MSTELGRTGAFGEEANEVKRRYATPDRPVIEGETG
jgi:hypothetical protein